GREATVAAPDSLRGRGLAMRHDTTMTGKKILIVDDEAGVRFGICDFLELHGYEVREADSCQQAQALFRESPAHAVIVDYELPDGNACELLPRLREIDPTVAALVLTGRDAADPVLGAIAGERVLTKPVELPALLEILHTLPA
ncbi:MAG: response regulator, partial [Gammaproteobacteria bacterium]